MYKKAQAAMEFLMTYGWAILVVLVAIGALAYFGVLNPSRFLPNSCTLTPGLSCTDFNAAVSGNSTTVTLIVRNGMGESIDLSSLNVANAGASVACTAIDPASLADGSQASYAITCTGIAIGDRVKGDITGTYTKGSGSLDHSFTGQLVTQAS